MARRVVRSAVQAAIKNLDQGTKVANEVIESAGKGATRAQMIKNCVNTVASNRSAAQAKNIAEAGGEAAANAARREAIDTAAKVAKTKTVSVNNVVSASGGGTSAVQKAKEIVDMKRTGQVIDGHNARARQTTMDTIVNDIKDRQATRDLNVTPKGTPAQNIANNMINHRNRTTKIGNVAMPDDANFYGYAFGTDIDKAYGRQNLLNGNGDISGVMDDIKTSEITGNYNRSQTRQQTQQQSKPKPNPEPQSNKDKIKNGIMDNVFGGLTETYQNGIKGDKGLWNSFVDAHTKDDGSIRMGRAVGTFMAASAAARVATGGGLYKDRYGNPNIIGVPFI